MRQKLLRQRSDHPLWQMAGLLFALTLMLAACQPAGEVAARPPSADQPISGPTATPLTSVEAGLFESTTWPAME